MPVEWRVHQPAGIEQAHDVAVLLDAVLVAHRPAGTRGREPVDLADVVVGEVVADRFEVGPEPERPARAQTGIAEPTPAERDHEALRREDVGVHEQVARAVSPSKVHAASPSGPRAPRGDRRQQVRAAAGGDDVRVERTVVPIAGSTRMSGGCGWRMRDAVEVDVRFGSTVSDAERLRARTTCGDGAAQS